MSVFAHAISRAAAIFLCSSMLFFVQSTRASEHLSCAVLSSSANLMETGGNVALVLALENKGASEVDLYEFAFGSNVLQLRAKRLSDGQELSPVVPLISPGVTPVRIAAGGSLSETVDLSEVFPGLQQERRKSAIEISWTLTLEPLSGCFVKTETITVVLPKAT